MFSLIIDSSSDLVLKHTWDCNTSNAHHNSSPCIPIGSINVFNFLELSPMTNFHLLKIFELEMDSSSKNWIWFIFYY